MIYALRVTSGQEKILAEMLVKKSKAEKLNIYSVIYLDNIKGYLFVEADEENTVVKLTQKIKHVKGFLRKSMALAEIQNLIQMSSSQSVTTEPGDTVEMVSGPFKGERAKVIKIDEAKDEITVELVEVAVPIPVTVKTKMLRLFKKAGASDDDK
ncbi:transcription elongation factor Spt5 [Candidatus Micrarchaeota archaeon]|nr:transcription elongation factor Spt5 [Candidatus Micrarchaeota archaeon]